MFTRSQSTGIPSLRSMLTCDKRLPPVSWNLSGLQENLFANPRSTQESSQITVQGIDQFATPSATGEVPVHISTGAPVARDEEPMPTFASRPSTMSSFILVDIPPISMVGQQRHQISELQFDKFPDSKPKALPVLIFHRMLCCGSKKWRWSTQWMNGIHRDQLRERIFQNLRC